MSNGPLGQELHRRGVGRCTLAYGISINAIWGPFALVGVVHRDL